MRRVVLSRALGLVAALIGLSGLAGHALHSATLVRPGLPQGATLDLASAFCLFAAGLLVFWLARPAWMFGPPLRASRWVAAMVGGAVAAIGLGMLIENATGIALGIDFASLQTWAGSEDPLAGRMAGNESLAYLLVGGALAFHPRAAGPVAGLALRAESGLAAAFAAAALLSGLPALDLMAGWQGDAIMGPLSACGLLLLATGTWLLLPRLSAEVAGSEEAEVEHVVIVATIVLSVVALVASGVGLVVVQKRVERLIVDHLNEQLSNRATLIASQLDERAERAAIIASRPLLQEALQRGAANPSDVAAREQLRDIAQSYLPHGFSAVAMQDLSGNTLATAGTFGSASDFAVGVSLRYRAQLLWQNGFRVRAELPVRDRGALIGRVVAEQPLWILSRQSFDPGAWGESQDADICAVSGDDAMACFPTRFRERTFVAPRIVAGHRSAMSRALDGESGVQKFVDERGRPMIAAFQPIATTGLGIQTRIARVEVDKPIRDQFVITVPLVLALVAAGIAVMRWRLRLLVRQMVATRHAALANAARFRAASEGSLDAFATLEAVRGDDHAIVDFRFTYLNANAEKLIAMRREDVLGQLLGVRMPLMRDTGWMARYANVVENGVAIDVETDFKVRGRVVWLRHHVQKLDDGVAVTARDISEVRRNAERLQQIAQTDALTGLPNRPLFMDRLDRAMIRARRGKRLMALMYLDVDRFKAVNDRFGHAVGDEVLKAVALRLAEGLRAEDTVARLGGDEFTVILENLRTKSDAFHAAEVIGERVREEIAVAGATTAVSVSIGIAFLQPADPGDASITGEHLIKAADSALYEVKRRGRDGYYAAPEDGRPAA